MGRAVGEHTFWRGSLWGRTVALQGDSSFTKFDLFELTDSRLLYWGTFRGNGFYGSEESHSFSSPYGWMDRWMSVGDFTQQRITDSVMDPRLRTTAQSGEGTLQDLAHEARGHAVLAPWTGQGHVALAHQVQVEAGQDLLS